MGQFRHTLGIIIGTISAGLLIFLLEAVNMSLYPIPAPYTMKDFDDPAKTKEIMHLMPTGAFVSVLIIYAIASFIGGIIATLISGKEKNWPSVVTGIILFGVGLWTAIDLTQPVWFMAGTLACIPFAWYGYYCVRKK